MEMTLERLKAIIGDQTCQISILQTEKAQLIVAYNKVAEENKQLKDHTQPGKSKKPKKAKIK